MKLVAIGVGTLLLAGACSAGLDISTTALDAAAQSTSTVVPQGSAVDALDPSAVDLTESEEALAALLIGPNAINGDYKLAGFAIDDPNGNGRIDDRWYPPRVRNENCSVTVDSAPGPVVAVSFIPGQSTGKFNPNSFAILEAALAAPHTFSIEVRVFDTAAQRDGYALTMQEFYQTVGQMECGIGNIDNLDLDGFEDFPFEAVEEMRDLMFSNDDAPEFTPHDVDYPAYGAKVGAFLSSTDVSQYQIGDQILLTVTVGTGPFTDPENRDPMSSSTLNAAIDAQVALLENNGFG